jgi:ribosomal protein S18 acetylase RimI-like enzyme
MTPALALRRARPADLPAILPLVRRFYAHFGYPYDEGEKARALGELLADRNHGVVWLATVDGALGGYALLSFYFSLEYGGRTAFVDELFMEEAYRGRGLGTSMLGLLEEEARRLGLKAIHLESEEENAGATALYLRLGFVDYRRRLLTKRL